MDKNLTISVKGLLVSGLVLLALVVAYLLGNAGTTTAEAAEDGVSVPAARTLTMSGFGEATAVPDQVTFDLSVRLLRPSVEEATAKAQKYAESTGQELGDVVTLREVSDQELSAIDESQMLAGELTRTAADAAAFPTPPVRAGRADLGVTIQVVWEFA